MSLYQTLIIDTVKCSAEDAAEIETIMRQDIFHSTLDWQTKGQLKKAAREAAELLPMLREMRKEYSQ